MVMARKNFDSLPLEWIRVFEGAGRTGSFTKAAQECGLTQAAVSQRIGHLERRIGAKLFVRQARGVNLTVEGEAWLPYATSALEILHRSADELFGAPLKKLVISASASIAQLWLAPRLAQMNHDSGLQISVSSMNIEADFAKQNASVEIRYGHGNWPDFQCHKLYPEVLAPLVAPRLIKGTHAWQTLPLIAVSGPRAGWQEWSAQTGEPPLSLPAIRFDTFAAALAAAKAGAGVLLASKPLCENEITTGALVQVSQYEISVDASYWILRKGRIPENQWARLVEALCLV